MPSLLPLLLPFVCAGLSSYHSAVDVPFVTHIVTVRSSMYSYIGKGRESFLRDRLVCFLCILIPCLHGIFNMIPDQSVFTHNFREKATTWGTQQKFYWFFVQTMFFLSLSCRFLFSFTRRKHKQGIQQMTSVHIVVEIRLACCRCLDFVYRQPKRFVASLKWNERCHRYWMRRRHQLQLIHVTHDFVRELLSSTLWR